MKSLLTILGLASLFALSGAARADPYYGNPYRYYRSPSYYNDSQRYHGYADHDTYRRDLTTPYLYQRRHDHLDHRRFHDELDRHKHHRHIQPYRGYGFDSRYKMIPRFGSSYGTPYRYYRSPSYYGGYSTWGRPSGGDYVSPRGYSSFSFGW